MADFVPGRSIMGPRRDPVKTPAAQNDSPTLSLLGMTQILGMLQVKRKILTQTVPFNEG